MAVIHYINIIIEVLSYQLLMPYKELIMKNGIFRFLLAVAIVLSLATVCAEEVKPVKYVFLFIGDGLSIPQRMMTEEFLRRTEKCGLLINEFESQGLTTTQAADAFITDSAASGTAIACGEKTNNGKIGMDASGKRRLESVAEVARDHGRKVGIITSVTLNHATPAAFYAHNASRGNYYQIGLDLVNSGFDYFGGGGIAKSNDKKDPLYKGNILELAEAAGYTVSNGKEGFAALKPGAGKVISIGVPGNALPYALDADRTSPRLADFTRQGIELLDNPKGFFIMVEGGKIDWMCHANDAATTLHEVIDFDNAVKVASEFARQNPADTLIVVTGDHETGGLTLGFAGTGYRSYIENLGAQTCSRDGMIHRFHHVENPDFESLKPLITQAAGLIFAADGKREKGALNLTENEEDTLKNTFDKHLKDGKFTGAAPLADAVIRILNNKSSVAWTTGAHTALPVSTTARGAQAQLFSNMLDNTDIAKRLKTVVR